MFGPVLRGELVSLEPPRSEDLSTYREWFSNPEVIKTLLARFAPSEKGEEEWFERAGTSEDQIFWRIVADAQTIGNTGIHGIDWINRGGRTGLVIGETTAWRKGYASEAVRLRTEYAFNELGLERLGSESFVENIPMHRALEKNGYRKIGRERRAIFRGGCWHDLYLFEVLREEWLAR